MSRVLLNHLLDETASKTPDNLAVKMEDRSITYGELLKRSNILANLLMHIGFEPGNVAGVFLNKSIEAVVSMFGVLKAGGAYIPLDSFYSPLSRIKNIIKISQAKFIISDRMNWEKLLVNTTEEDCFLAELKVILVAHDGIDFINIDSPTLEHGVLFSSCSSADLLNHIQTIDDDLAYILYTSGSTGTPKGVMLTHLNALTFVKWALSYFKPTKEDVFSNFAPFHFDLSVFDIYVCIAVGGTLNLLPSKLASNPRAIVEWISNSGITILYSVPSMWISILNFAGIGHGSFKSLKQVLFAGEVFPPKYLKQLMEMIPHAEFYNLYGPTETNVCTCYHVAGVELVGDRPVPIGSPCDNTGILVLNNEGELAVSGELGELLVRGSIVTKGYYRDSEKTDAAFMKSTLSNYNGAMFYKTGDIVMVCDENIFEYIGRKDFMVKCSGFRVELQEVEYALYKNLFIEEAVVVPIIEEGKDNIEICAVLKLKENEGFSIIKLKKFLSDILPKYMIPQVILTTGSIPKNANGKPDRQKVSAWASEKVKSLYGGDLEC